MNLKINSYKSQHNPLLGVPAPDQRPLHWPITPPSPISLLFIASGLYTWKSLNPGPIPDTAVLTPAPNMSFTWGFGYEALRLDVDGPHPQMAASGTIKNLFHTVHWQAQLEASSHDSWLGEIYDKRGDGLAFPYTAVQITATRSMFTNQRKLNVTFKGEGVPDRHSILKFESPYFRQVSLTCDFATTRQPLTAVTATHSSTNPITLQEVFQQAGFDATITTRDIFANEMTTADAPWHEQELHDAMQFYWANHDELINPNLWVLFAPLHQAGSHIGATIYDEIGPDRAQATAVFTDSFIAQPPPNMAESAQWLLFGLTCRQIGAALHVPAPASNHQHPIHSPLITDYLTDCFSPDILHDMRHAPTTTSASGTADWYDQQGFTAAPEPSLHLQLRVQRQQPIFEFLEPVMLELALTNATEHPQWLDKSALTAPENLTLILKKEGRAARQFIPYKRDYQMPQPQQLMPGQSLADTLFVSAGLNGWDLAEPGYYTLHAALNLADKIIVTEPLQICIKPPKSFAEEYLAQDFFADDVGRILAFNGSQFFHSGNQVLREVIARLPLRHVAYHIAYVLGHVLTYEYKRLALASGDSSHYLQIITQPSQPKEAKKLLHKALMARPDTAVITFGPIRWRQHMEQFSLWLTQQGDAAMAAQCHELCNQPIAAVYKRP